MPERKCEIMTKEKKRRKECNEDTQATKARE